MNSLTQAIKDLEVAYARVEAIDRESLSDERKKDRANALRGIRRSINRIDTVVFSKLDAEARGATQDLQSAAARLNADLDKVKGVVGLIDTVAGVLQKVLSLLKLIGV
jgi:hypothetical protein